MTYKSVGPDGTAYLSTADTNLDGKDVPHVIGGKPSGQTFATRKVDADNKVFSPNGGTGKSTQYWDRK